jgi:hypothetical protein
LKMILLDRYLSAFAQHLPADRSEEIVRELRANIMDKLDALAEELGREINDNDVSGLLRELGHPQQVADGYVPPQHLVAPEPFAFYKQVLSYGALTMFTIELLKAMSAFFSSGYFSVSGFAYGLAAGFDVHGLLIFAFVTGMFYILSNLPRGKPVYRPYQSWRPEQFPPVTQPWQKIRLGQQSGGFSMSLFFMLIPHYPLIMPDAAKCEFCGAH